MSKCLHPTICWQCGFTTCKMDSVLSPRLVFSEVEAYRYFEGQVSDSLLHCVFGRGRQIRHLMSEARIELPCGKCAACQIQKRKDMSVRLAHEASQFENCCFITLTYDEDNLPLVLDADEKPITSFDAGSDISARPTLCPADVQKFMKRLRRHLTYIPKKKKDGRDHIDKVRYFAVGEYGGKTHRPHYHILIFGWRPSDLQAFKLHKGRPVFRSSQIEKLWTKGYSTVCDVNPYVAKYCARYVTKKFARLSEPTKDDAFIVPEFVLQSTRDGAIGATWFDKYGAHACEVGLCTLRVGDRIQKCAIPKYYWNRLRRKALPLWLSLRDQRIAFVKSHDTSPDLDAVRRMVDVHRYRQSQEIADEVF